MTDTLAKEHARSQRSTGYVATRLLSAAAVTAAIGALVNFIHERLFDPEAYAAGSVLSRAAVAFVFPFPFILAGLLIVGIPAAHVLRRFRIEGGLTFGIAGAAAGGLIIVVAAAGLPRLQAVLAAYGCASAVSLWALLVRRT